MGEKKIKIVGKTLSGEARTYELNKISALTGVRLVHEYGSVILSNMDLIQNAFAAFREEKPDGEALTRVLGFVGLIPKIITWPRLAELARELLGGGKVDGEELDAEGMCTLFGEDPFELYTALFWALAINYPKYFNPFLQALDEGAVDTTHASAVKV